MATWQKKIKMEKKKQATLHPKKKPLGRRLWYACGVEKRALLKMEFRQEVPRPRPSPENLRNLPVKEK